MTFVIWNEAQPGRLCWCSAACTAEPHCCAPPVFQCSLPYQSGNFFPADKTHKSAVLLCRLCGNKRADLVCSVCLVLGRSTTWSALLMPRSRHSRTALLCAADAQEPVPRYYGISSGENYLRGTRRRAPGDWTEGPVPNFTASHQGENHLCGIRRRFPGVQALRSSPRFRGIPSGESRLRGFQHHLPGVQALRSGPLNAR